MSARTLACVCVIAFVLVVPAGALFGLYGNSSASPGSTALRIGFAQRIDSLNPYVGLSDSARLFYSLVYDSLQGVGGDLNPIPCLAATWGVVSDEVPYGSVWEYNLSAGAIWSDGLPVTAEDIAWNINLNSNPANYTSMWAYQPYAFFIEYAEVYDADTVRVHFWDRATGDPVPVAYGDSILIPMLPKHVLENKTVAQISFLWDGTPVVGSGPFVPTATVRDDWTSGGVVTLVRNAEYFGGPDYGRYVQFDKVELHFYSTPQELSLALENSEIDVAKLPIDDFITLKTKVDLGTLLNVVAFDGRSPDGYWENMLINMNNAGPNPSRLDPAIRHAMAKATDKVTILESFYHGEGTPGSTLISPVSDWHYDLTMGEELTYDIDAANALLNASGYPDIDTDGIRECTASSYAVQQGLVPEGTKLIYTAYVALNYVEEVEVLSFLRNEWQQIGIQLDISIVTEAVLSAIVYSYSYDTAVWYWSMDPDPNYILFSQSRNAWSGWSDTKYSSQNFEENYTSSVMELDHAARHVYVDNCQRIDYQDAPYIIFAYVNQTVAWRTDTFTGWGDWDAEPGRSIAAAWSGNPLYFQLVPLVEYDSPPTDVSLAANPTFVAIGTAVIFTATAMDPDGDNLSFYIELGDGASDLATSSAPMYVMHVVNFSHAYSFEGDYVATVWVDDGSGLPGANVSASVTVHVLAPGERSVDYRWYDLFNVVSGEWWDTRHDVYGVDDPITDHYPYIIRFNGTPAGNHKLYSSMRLDVSARNLPEINMNSWPQFLPLFGSERGGNASIDWYMQYLTSADATRYPAFVGDNSDGWLNILNGTVTLDKQASRAVMNLTDADFDDFADWWSANNNSFLADYLNWLSYESYVRLYIYNWYEYPLTILYATIDAQRVGDTIVLTYDFVTWGLEVLMARWLHEAFLPAERYFEGFNLNVTIGAVDADLDLSTVVEYAAYAWETTLVPDGELYGQPCWVWENSLGDVLPSQVGHPPSAYDPYLDAQRISKSPCSLYWHDYVPYEYTPSAWNLSAGERLSFEWPAGSQLFYSRDSLWPLVPVEVYGPMSAKYSEPMEIDFPGQVTNNQITRNLTFTGPIDMWAWSKDQFRHEDLASEWGRLGELPRGVPWIEFQIDSGLNTPPTALFDYSPLLGDVFTDYLFDASDSWDLENLTSLEVRWDWDGDGTYDTSWSNAKVVNHQFATPGTYNVTVEVRDLLGLTDTKVIQIVVVELIPELPSYALPLLAISIAFALMIRRRRR